VSLVAIDEFVDLGGELGAVEMGWWFPMTVFIEFGVVVIVVVIVVIGIDIAVV